MQREYMIQFRKKRGLSIQDMAKKCKISKTLLEMLEASEDVVTHPNIAERVRKAYKLTEKQYEGLMPEHHRKSSPNYNPDLYREDDFDYARFAVSTGWSGTHFM